MSHGPSAVRHERPPIENRLINNLMINNPCFVLKSPLLSFRGCVRHLFFGRNKLLPSFENTTGHQMIMEIKRRAPERQRETSQKRLRNFRKQFRYEKHALKMLECSKDMTY